MPSLLIKRMPHSAHRQRGVVTLLIALITLVLLSIMTIYTGRVSVMDQRMSGNEYRYREAFAAAQAGLDQTTIAFKQQTAATAINPTAVTLNANQGVSFDSAVTVDTTGKIFTVSSVGSVIEGGATVAQATLSHQFSLLPGLGGSGVSAPISIAGNALLGGGFNVVANPSGACQISNTADCSVPVSVWTSGNVALASAAVTTCYTYTGTANGGCDQNNTTDRLTGTFPGGTTVNAGDVVANDPNFPSDLFLRTFGVSATNWQAIQGASKPLTAATCSALDDADSAADSTGVFASGLYWVQGGGECIIQNTLGRTTNPIILIMDGTSLSMNANAIVYGLVYMFGKTGASTAHTLTALGGALVRGAIVADFNVGGNLAGSFTVWYDAGVLNNLSGTGTTTQSPAASTLGYIPGSWRDF